MKTTQQTKTARILATQVNFIFYLAVIIINGTLHTHRSKNCAYECYTENYRRATHLCDVVVRLLRKPAFSASPEDFGKPHSHFGRYSTLPIHEFRQRSASNAERGSRILDGQSQWFNTLAQYETARVWWIFHRHGSTSISGSRHNQRPRLHCRRTEKLPAN